MARTAIPLTALTLNGGVAQGGVAADVANGHNVAIGGDTSKLVIHARNTAGSAKTVTVRKGDYPPALNAGQGDLVVSVPATAERLITVEGARFLQDDGSLDVDLETGFTGTLQAYKLPRGM